MRFSPATILHFFRQHVLTLGVVVAVLVLVIGTFTIVLPRYRTVQALGGLNYNQKVSQLEAQRAYLSDLQQLRDNVQALSQEDIQRLDAVVPKGKDIPGIFKQMQGFAREAGMDLLSISVSEGSTVAPSGSAATSKIRSLSISAVLGGQLDYARLKNFLNVTSRQAPLLDLTAVTYSGSTTTTTATTYTFSFRSYYLVP
jgi:hypothetical protein